MKINPVRLKRIIQKSSFNYRLMGARVLFKADKITSQMVSPDHTYAVLINTPNDVLSGIKRKNGVELNFDLSNKPFSRRIFHQFDSDECEAKITDNHIIINDNQRMKARLTVLKVDNIVLEDDLPKFKSACETLIDVDKDFIHKALKLCKAGYQLKESDIQFIIKNEKAYLGIEKEFSAKTSMQLDSSISGKTKQVVSISFSRIDFKEVISLIKSEKQKEYQLKFTYDDSLKSGYASVVSKDGTEQYILYSKRENKAGELISIEHRYATKPEIPKKWSYDESVEKVREISYKWKNLGAELLKELWIAREILAKSKSEAAKIMHGTLVPWMTWGQYCADIGSSRQVVNRWLKRAFKGVENTIVEPKQIEYLKNEKENISQKDGEKYISDEHMKSIRKVVGKRKNKVVDAYNGRIAPEQINKLMEDIENGVEKEAVVHVNNRYTYREWFKPLFDGLMCFTNGNKEGSCFVYFGKKQKNFISEFSKHGVVMVKAD